MIAHLPSIGNPKEGALLKRLALQTAEVPTAAGSRTGARRTDLQNRGQATSRPREAHEESGTQSPYSPNRAGGVQRGWQSTEGTLTPLWPSLLLSRERERRGCTKENKHKKSDSHCDCPFRARMNVQLWSAPLRLRGLFLESGGFSKGACGLCLRARGSPTGRGLRGPSTPARGTRPLTLFRAPVPVVLSGSGRCTRHRRRPRFPAYRRTRWYRRRRRLPGPGRSANPRP